MDDLFAQEQQVLEEAELRLCQMRERNEGAASDYENLLRQYRRLLKQLRRIVRISDRTAKELSDNRNLLFEETQHDALTGIYNRRFLNEIFEQIPEDMAGCDFSVYMLDIDYFKKYNDTYGHDIGDHCLRRIARTLAEMPLEHSQKGFVARYGGEEFFAVLPGAEKTEAIHFAEKVLKRVRELEIEHVRNPEGIVTISIGAVSEKMERSKTLQYWLKKADLALYESKRKGRNCYTLFETE